MIKDKPIRKILEVVSEELNIPQEEIEKVIETPFAFAYRTITQLDFPNMSLEEFKTTKKNFNFPALGKFSTSELVFKKLNNIKDND